MLSHLFRRALALTCSALIDGTEHRICCRIPEWTAHVGQRWKPYDEAPWNLYNMWWVAGQWIGIQAEYEGPYR